MNILTEAKNVFSTEITALTALRDALNGDFEEAVKRIQACKGKVVITGMGKSGHIGCKIAATMASLGTPAFFLHPGEALHGDLGMVTADDIVIAISNSGESDEIIHILPNLKVIGASIIAVTGNRNSTLVRYSDHALVFPPFKEACPMNLAPTSSTTLALVLGDALAVVLSQQMGFGKENYALFHPAGSLGKKLLLKVSDLMSGGEKNACVRVGDTLKHAIIVMSERGLNIVNVVDADMNLHGILTDGDLRRLLERGVNVYDCTVDAVMIRNPTTIEAGALAAEALNLMTSRAKQITALPVLDDRKKVVGSIRLYDIVKAGIQ